MKSDLTIAPWCRSGVTWICDDIEINKSPFIQSYRNQVLYSTDVTHILMGHSMRMYKMLSPHGYDKYGRVDQIALWKKTFGKQFKTWLGGSENRRFYIWTFKKDDSILYALIHNTKGMCFEYFPRSNHETIKYMLMKVLFSLENVASWDQ